MEKLLLTPPTSPQPVPPIAMVPLPGLQTTTGLSNATNTTTTSAVKPVVSAVVKASQSSTNKTKDGLIRMLLQSNPLQLSRLVETEEEEEKCPRYIARLGGTERQVELVMLDHAYAKPWNWKPESSFCKPA